MASNSPGRLIPFWNQNSSSYSKLLWLPLNNGIDLVDKSKYNNSLNKLSQNTWFSVNRSNNKVLDDFKLPILNINKPIPENRIKCKKIQLFPTSKQKEILNNWFNTTRWVYNKCLESIKNKQLNINRYELREKWLNGSNIKNNYSWSEQTPSAIRDGAIDDLLVVYKTNLNKNIRFDVKYRSKKSLSESIVIPKKDYKRANVFFPRSLGIEGIKSSETLPEKLDFDTRLQRTNLGHFYLCLLSDIEIKSDNQAPKIKNIISLDPGVRTFITGYDPNGSIYEWGKNNMKRLFKLGCKADKIKSLINGDRIKHMTRYRLRKKVLLIFKRIKDLVDTLHKNLAKWLCENYHYILIPKFNSSGMVRRKERKINNKTVRNILTWSHYRFRQRLLLKAREYPWCNIIETTEEYTSKTCGNCGTIKDNLGGNKIFNCSSCKIKIDRDFNGARNILIKYFTKLNLIVEKNPTLKLIIEKKPILKLV